MVFGKKRTHVGKKYLNQVVNSFDQKYIKKKIKFPELEYFELFQVGTTLVFCWNILRIGFYILVQNQFYQLEKSIPASLPIVFKTV